MALYNGDISNCLDDSLNFYFYGGLDARVMAIFVVECRLFTLLVRSNYSLKMVYFKEKLIVCYYKKNKL